MSQPVVISENSTEGPVYDVTFVGGLKEPEPGKKWLLIVDGGPLQNGAVIVASQIAK